MAAGTNGSIADSVTAWALRIPEQAANTFVYKMQNDPLQSNTWSKARGAGDHACNRSLLLVQPGELPHCNNHDLRRSPATDADRCGC